MNQITKENTLLIFIGDNGTDNDILRGYSEYTVREPYMKEGLGPFNYFGIYCQSQKCNRYKT